MRKRFLLLLAIVLCVGCGQPSIAARRAPQGVQAASSPAAYLPLAVANTSTAPSPAPTPTATATATQTRTPTNTPTQTPIPEPWRFVVLGDTRTAGLDPPAITGEIVALARAHQPKITLALGDLINALNDQASVREQWVRWRATVAPLGENQTSPWMLATPGNHDVQGNPWATDLMVEAFPELPTNGPAGLERLAYSYDYQGVRFISIHSEIYGDGHHLGSVQLAWLEGLLQNNPNRYTIVFSHDPAFPVGPHIGSALDVYPQERDQLWTLFKQYQVTAYFAGHEHLYNRQTIDGMTQLVVGTSGSTPYTGYGGDFYHYLVAEVRANDIEMIVYDSTGAERDRFSLP